MNNLKIIKNIYISKIKNRPYKLNFAVTSICNSNCQTCNTGRLYRKNPNIANDDLSLSEIKLFFKKLPKTIFWISLSGGEPFLRKDFTKIIQAASKNIKNLTLVSIPSNGLLTKMILKKTEQILKDNKNVDFFINFSIDGPEKIHNKVRGLPGYKKTWNTYLKTLKLTKRYPHLKVGLETTVSQFNINHLATFFTKIPKNHKVTITIAHQGYLYLNQSGKDDFTITGTRKELKNINKIISSINKRLDITKADDLIEYFYLKKIPQFLIKKRSPLPCCALSASFAISPKGIIIPCFMWGKNLGSVKSKNFNFERFWKSKKSKTVKKIINHQKCPICWTPCEAYQGIIKSLTGRSFFRLF